MSIQSVSWFHGRHDTQGVKGGPAALFVNDEKYFLCSLIVRSNFLGFTLDLVVHFQLSAGWSGIWSAVIYVADTIIY